MIAKIKSLWQRIKEWFWWNILIHYNEFHSHLDLNYCEMANMNTEEMKLYLEKKEQGAGGEG
jgi:hypothetical protein